MKYQIHSIIRMPVQSCGRDTSVRLGDTLMRSVICTYRDRLKIDHAQAPRVSKWNFPSGHDQKLPSSSFSDLSRVGRGPPPFLPVWVAFSRYSMTHIDWSELDKSKYFTIGPTCFLAVRFVLYPPALVKTRLQVQNNTATNEVLYKGTRHAFKTIIQQEGVRALWQGFVPKSLGLVAGSVYVGTYEFLRSLAVSRGWRESSANMTAGAIGSLVSQFIVVPTDVVSQCMAVRKAGKGELSFRGEVIQIYHERGSTVRGFYRGFGASISTYMPTSALWWTMYGIYKDYTPSMIPMSLVGNEYYRMLLTQSIAGGFAGATAGFFTNPMDVVKVRKQLSSNDSSVRDIVKQLWRESGSRAFLKGISARVLSMAPSGFITVSVYEFIKRVSKKTHIS